MNIASSPIRPALLFGALLIVVAPAGAEPAPAPTQAEAVTGVQLPPGQASRLGIATEAAAAASFARETVGVASVLDPQNLLQLAVETAAANAAAQGSARAHARVKALNAADGAASDQAVESAAAQSEQDQARKTGLERRLAAEWAGPLSHPSAALIDALATRRKVIVRIELDPGDRTDATPVGARFESYSGSAGAQKLETPWLAPTRDPLRPGPAWLALADGSANLVPGERGRGYLDFAGAPRSGARIPRTAVVLFDRRSWVYVDRGNGRYQRVAISTHQPLADGYFVERAIAVGEPLVVAGAALLLAEERGDKSPPEAAEDDDDD